MNMYIDWNTPDCDLTTTHHVTASLVFACLYAVQAEEELLWLLDHLIVRLYSLST